MSYHSPCSHAGCCPVGTAPGQRHPPHSVERPSMPASRGCRERGWHGRRVSAWARPSAQQKLVRWINELTNILSVGVGWGEVGARRPLLDPQAWNPLPSLSLLGLLSHYVQPGSHISHSGFQARQRLCRKRETPQAQMGTEGWPGTGSHSDQEQSWVTLFPF